MALATGGEVSSALEAIILAGGAGSRFGGKKLTAPWRGGALIDGALETAFAAPARSVIVVTGADRDVADAARVWAAARGETPRLRAIHAEDHAEGIAATLRAGIGALADDAFAVFVFLGDMPLVPATIAPALVTALDNGALAAAPVFQGRRGHPVLFRRELFAALTALTGDDGARALLAGLGGAVALVEAPDGGVLFDVDLAADLGALEEGG